MRKRASFLERGGKYFRTRRRHHKGTVVHFPGLVRLSYAIGGGTPKLSESGGNQVFSGADVEFDPIDKVFLVAQPVWSSSPSGSTINGVNFSNASNVVPMHVALNPGSRSGFVDGPNLGELQLFTY